MSDRCDAAHEAGADPHAKTKPKRPPLWFTLLVEWGPALVFLLTYQASNLFLAKAALMVAATFAFVAAWRAERRVAVLPLLSLVVVLGFGSLALLLQSETVIKVTPTAIDFSFGTLLLFAYLRDLPWLRYSIGPQMPVLIEAAWRPLTLRYSIYFLTMASLNELIWRTQPTDLWVLFKTYGGPALLLLFIASQVPYVGRHRLAA